MGIVETASFITAFLAGMAALFAPCCVGVLLPAYLASVFRTKAKIFLMTFVYYLGLLTVFVPLGLGIASLGEAFSRYHNVIFTLGGVFMVILGISLILGKNFMLPIHVKPQLKGYDFGSIYVLGIFSGIATTCCAPVLAGVLALSALPGSWLLGAIYALVFVTGMVIPLFIVALLTDRTNLLAKFQSLRKRISYRLLGKQISVNLSHLISGILFVLFGVLILLFERNNPDIFGSKYQLEINLVLAQITRTVSRTTQVIPEAIWAVIFIFLFVIIAWLAYRQVKSQSSEKEEK
ncbi:MAG TPA: cytochrome c biogenesis protein CcdA [Candidatus Nanoarchaeia archaeon]|nr:hypothetical protein [uncultured archaeon]